MNFKVHQVDKDTRKDGQVNGKGTKIKQKTAYEIRRRDWSSDVCSSDLEYMIPSPTGQPSTSASQPMNQQVNASAPQPTQPQDTAPASQPAVTPTSVPSPASRSNVSAPCPTPQQQNGYCSPSLLQKSWQTESHMPMESPGFSMILQLVLCVTLMCPTYLPWHINSLARERRRAVMVKRWCSTNHHLINPLSKSRGPHRLLSRWPQQLLNQH